MRNLEHLEEFKVNNPYMQSLMDKDFIGTYILHLEGSRLEFGVLVSIHDKEWEHVSVSTELRTPRWHEMKQIKELFFDDNEVVMQLHPAKSEYVNNHPYCLHLWRPVKQKIPMPKTDMV